MPYWLKNLEIDQVGAVDLGAGKGAQLKYTTFLLKRREAMPAPKKKFKKSKFGAAVLDAAQKKDATLQSLADELVITEIDATALLEGKANPTGAQIARLAKFLDLEVDQLSELAEASKTEPPPNPDDPGDAEVEKLRKEKAKLEKRLEEADELKEEVRKLKSEREEERFSKMVSDHPYLPGKPEEVKKLLKRAPRDVLDYLTKQIHPLLKKHQRLQRVGTGRPAGLDTPEDEIHLLAKELMDKDPDLTEAQAITKAYKQRPEHRRAGVFGRTDEE